MELAFVVLVLLVMAFGAVQFGLLYSVKLKVEHAAREGARYASVAVLGTTDATIKQHVVDTAPDLNPALTTADVAVTTPNGRFAGQPVVVQVTYSYRPTVPIVRALLPNPMSIQARAQMKIEG